MNPHCLGVSEGSSCPQRSRSRQGYLVRVSPDLSKNGGIVMKGGGGVGGRTVKFSWTVAQSHSRLLTSASQNPPPPFFLSPTRQRRRRSADSIAWTLTQFVVQEVPERAECISKSSSVLMLRPWKTAQLQLHKGQLVFIFVLLTKRKLSYGIKRSRFGSLSHSISFT